ncbi:MAG: hypothetical protein M1834_006791 [Cirrosporium novae-zelandiae]|nr:MAG: hypothetical protein M1834_006791 [Cirrosporium novae-zelandiae]
MLQLHYSYVILLITLSEKIILHPAGAPVETYRAGPYSLEKRIMRVEYWVELTAEYTNPYFTEILGEKKAPKGTDLIANARYPNNIVATTYLHYLKGKEKETDDHAYFGYTMNPPNRKSDHKNGRHPTSYHHQVIREDSWEHYLLLAEAVYSSWLKGYMPGKETDGLNRLSPYKNVDWKGDCSHSALREAINGTITMSQKERYHIHNKNPLWLERHRAYIGRSDIKAKARTRMIEKKKNDRSFALRLNQIAKEKRAAAKLQNPEEYQAKVREATRKAAIRQTRIRTTEPERFQQERDKINQQDRDRRAVRKEEDPEKDRTLLDKKAKRENRKNSKRKAEDLEGHRAYCDANNKRVAARTADMKENDPVAYRAFLDKKNEQKRKTRAAKKAKSS